MDMAEVTTGNAAMDAVVDTFGVMLVPGLASGADSDGVVELSLAGAGEVVYKVVEDTDAELKDEWVALTVMFEWESADLMPANAMGTVTVSFNPVSTMGGDTLVDVGSMLASPLPRFVASNNTQSVIDISICTTTLLFPFVTNQLRFDTGLVITNTSQESGSCTIEFSGSNSPDDEFTSQPVAGGAQWVDLASVVAPAFQGYITATCGFRDAYGFAFISNGYPGGPPTLAQGYLAVVME